MAKCLPSAVRTGLVNSPCFTEEEVETGQRTELARAAEVVGHRPRARPSPLHISHEKVFVQPQVSAMPFPFPTASW